MIIHSNAYFGRKISETSIDGSPLRFVAFAQFDNFRLPQCIYTKGSITQEKLATFAKTRAIHIEAEISCARSRIRAQIMHTENILLHFAWASALCARTLRGRATKNLERAIAPSILPKVAKCHTCYWAIGREFGKPECIDWRSTCISVWDRWM